MSFDFTNNISQFKAQSAYKDGGGMGGGGMYMKQKKKKKDEEEKDLFEFSDKKNNEDDVLFDVNSNEIKVEDKLEVSQDTFFNKFVNWFRLKN